MQPLRRKPLAVFVIFILTSTDNNPLSLINTMSEGDNRSQQSAAVPPKKELEKYCYSDSLSERGLREMFERHGLTPNQNRLSEYGDARYEVCDNEKVTEGIIQCLLEYFPDAATPTDDGWTPLHTLCSNKNVTLDIIKLLVDAAPESVRSVDNDGWMPGGMPLHCLCENEEVDEATAVLILKFLLEKHPEAVRHANDGGYLPIHYACWWRSPEFCQELIDAYPDSVRSVDNYECTPLHHLCDNNQVDDTAAMQVLKLLIDKYPEAVWHPNDGGFLPIHYACRWRSPEFCQELIDAYPDSVRSVTGNGCTPLYYLCHNRKVDEAATVEILKLLIEESPDSVRHADNRGNLPIHYASRRGSLELCRVLIEAYPASERITDAAGNLPLHNACEQNSLATVEYLYGLYPDAVRGAADGLYPIHAAIAGIEDRDDPTAAVEIVQFLQDCDPNQKLLQFEGKSLLHFACEQQYDDSSIEAGLQLIKVLFDAHPEAIFSVSNDGNMPLHCLCENEEVDEAAAIQILKFLLEKHPEAVRHANDNGNLPIHMLCENEEVDEAAAIHILKFLLEKHPEAARHANNKGRLPIHIAAGTKSPEFCRVLIEAYPGSVRVTNAKGLLPLHYACKRRYNDSNIKAGIQVIKILFDAHPEEIRNNRIASRIHRRHQQVQAFINGELVYARQATNHRLMTTPDDNGQLPLHTALENNVRLGSIKLLVKGNPYAIRSIDDTCALPLHVACEHHNSACVVQYLLDLDARILKAVDYDNNTALHYACRGAKHNTIAMLLEKYDAALVSKRNAHGKLPIDLLWESNAVEDRDSVEYTGSVFQLVRANPEMIQSAI